MPLPYDSIEHEDGRVTIILNDGGLKRTFSAEQAAERRGKVKARRWDALARITAEQAGISVPRVQVISSSGGIDLPEDSVLVPAWTEHEHDFEHDHPELAEADRTLAQGYANLHKQLGEHSHDERYASKDHPHSYLEDSVVHAVEAVARQGIDVSKLAQALIEHTADHQFAKPHEHPFAPLDAFQRLLEAVEGLSRDVEELKRRPVYDPNHTHADVARETSRLDARIDEVRQVVTALAKPAVEEAEPEPHQHVFDRNNGDGHGWRCVCGELAGRR